MKAKNILGMVLVALLMAACKPNPQGSTAGAATDSTAQAAPVVLPQSFYKTLHGKMGDAPVTMHLTKSDSSFSGNYIDDRDAEFHSFNGWLSAAGLIELYVDAAVDAAAPIWRGKFTNDSLYEGNYELGDSSAPAKPFQLTTMRDPFKITVTRAYQENCKGRDAHRAHPEEDNGYLADNVCSYIKVDQMEITTGRPEVDALVNATLLQQVLANGEGDFKTLEAYLKSIDQVEAGAYYAIDHYFDIVTLQADVLVVSHLIFLNEGGAHPIGGAGYLNFDLETGKVIALKDLLKPHFEARLNLIAGAIYHGVDEEVEAIDSKFELNDNVAVTKTGLRFKFAPYEIASYAEGMPEILIPYTQIEDLLLPGGIVAKVRGK